MLFLLSLQAIPNNEPGNPPYTARAFCADLARVCRTTTSRLQEIRSVANKACMDEMWTVDETYLDPADRDWLHDLACDATKIIFDSGGLGYVTIEANDSTPAETAWRLLMQVCDQRPRCSQRRSAPSRNLQTQSESLLGLTSLHVATNGPTPTLPPWAPPGANDLDVAMAIGLSLSSCLLVAVLAAAAYVWYRARRMQTPPPSSSTRVPQQIKVIVMHSELMKAGAPQSLAALLAACGLQHREKNFLDEGYTLDYLLSAMERGEAVAKSDLRDLKLTLGECRKILTQLRIDVPVDSQPLSF